MPNLPLPPDPHGVFIADKSVDLAKILAKHAAHDTVYEIRQVFTPWKPLLATGIGFTVMAACHYKPTLGSLGVSMLGLMVGGLGLYHLILGTKTHSVDVQRRELNAIMDAIQTAKKT